MHQEGVHHADSTSPGLLQSRQEILRVLELDPLAVKQRNEGINCLSPPSPIKRGQGVEGLGNDQGMDQKGVATLFGTSEDFQGPGREFRGSPVRRRSRRLVSRT